MLQLAPHPPLNEQQLLGWAQQLAGHSLGELAELANVQMPVNFKREKGFSGQLIERYLGAEAGSKPQQDFASLGIELKTIPINAQGMPLETTYVCFAHLTDIASQQWASSNVRNKLSRVLWVPIEGERSLPVQQRRIATPMLWSLSGQQEQVLQQDWEELMEMIALGKVAQITARHGQALHLRPKAADGKALTQAVGKDGQRIHTRPRGFYLRTTFTGQILSEHFGLA